MSTNISGGRPLLRGRVLGFPVHLDLSFIVIMAFLGYFPGVTAQEMIIWLLVTPIAVLVHELGHAVAARSAGAQPEIALAGFGGVTTFVPPGPLSRFRSLVISVAGPLVGLALGLVLLALRRTLGDAVVPGSWQATALWDGVFTCIGWSVLNLLPVLPLDGGQAMRELLPGAPQQRTRRANAVSLVVAIAAGIAAYLWFQQPFLLLFMTFFAVTNAMALRNSAGGAAHGHDVQVTPEQAVVGLIWQGQAAQARQLLESLPSSAEIDLAVHGAVLALTGNHDQGHALLDQEAQRRPDDPNAAALLLLTLAIEHDWDAVLATLHTPIGTKVPAPVIERAIEEAAGIGREDVAGRLTVLMNTRS